MSVSRSTIESETEFVLDGTHGSPVRVDEGIPVLSAQNVKGGRLSWDTARFTNEEEHAAFSKRLSLRRGDLLLTIVGTIGRAAVLEETPPPLVFQRSVSIMRPKRDSLDSRFFYFVTQSDDFQRQLERSTNKSSQAGVYLKKLKAVTIPLPPLAEQKRIAGILDAADALRAKRRESLAQLHTLLQSTFLEIFGDPVTNPMGWEELNFGDIAEDTRIGLVRSSKEFGLDFDIPYVRMDAVTANGDFLPEKVQLTDAEEDEIQAFALRSGDFLFNTRNSKELVGKVCVFPGPDGWLFNNNLMRVRFVADVEPVVVATQFRFRRVQRELEKRKSGTTSVFAVYWKSLRTLPVLVPPVDLQRRFAAIVESIEQQKATQRAHLDELDTLFASLQSRAFRGDL